MMKSFTDALIITSGLAIVLAAGAAQAKPAHHHKSSQAVSETEVLKAEVAALRAEVDTLENRLAAQDKATQAAQQQAHEAQSAALAARDAAQVATTQAAQDDAKIQTLPTEVEAAVKKNAPKPGWWNDTKIGGTIFADVSTISNKNAAGKTAQSGTDFDIKRAYFIVDHRFNDTYSFNFTTDFTFDSNTTSPSGASKPTNNEAGGANTASGIKATQLFIKKAYLQAHYADAFNVRLGGAELAWAPFVEGLYGYRYINKVLIDRVSLGTTTDWGVHVFGTLAKGLIGYQVSVVDGEGFKQPAIGTANRTNSVDVEGRVNAQAHGFTVAVGGYEGKLGGAVENVVTYNTAQRFDALAAYGNSRFRIAGEYLWARYWKDVTQANPAKTNVSTGYSLFGSVNLSPRIALFGRYDWVKPLANTAPSEHENYFHLGAAYKVVNGIDVALVYKRDSVWNGSLTTGDGVIGVPSGATKGEGTYDEFGLYTQIKY
jgi:hypothetical protein